jgi:prevent-host-death family protein
MLMAAVYTTYQAKVKLSEILRKVRSGQLVYVTYRGRKVAEIRPVPAEEETDLEARLKRLEEEGVLTNRPFSGKLPAPVANKPGALKRFLKERE